MSGSSRVETKDAFPREITSRSLPAIRTVRSSRFARILARWLVLLLIVMFVALLLLPWQQSVRGTGRVVAYTPLERQFEIKTLIKGQLTRWEPGVIENAFVKKGTPLAQIEDVDPEYERRLIQKLDFANLKVRTAQEMVATMTDQLDTNRDYRDQLLEIAGQQIRASELDLESTIQTQRAAEADLDFKRANFEREKELFNSSQGQLTSQLEFQKSNQEFLMAEAKYEAAKVELESSRTKLAEARLKRDATDQETRAKIQETEAKLQKANTDLLIYNKEVVEAETDLSRYRQSKVIVAPRSGYIFKLHVNQEGQPVKEGDPLLTLIPDTQTPAVALYIDGNDLPLVELGSPVRLQFEGYPAVQFTPGWPGAAIGTFGGRVEIIDSTDDGQGRFRVVVLPDPNDTPWPADRFTRQGVRVNGWILLRSVPLWYELWRQMNGFPPLFSNDAAKDDFGSGKAKPVLPK